MREDRSWSAAGPGFIYTFYFYKGGVGRSMAMANVGVLMALDDYKVLLVDWDLEAPGLEAYFHNTTDCKLDGDARERPGIVDLLESRVTKYDLSWRKCLLKVSFKSTSLDMISAGRRSDDYRQRVQSLNWGALFEKHRVGNYLNDLRDEWRGEYDFVLVDSRTGITDIGDICTVLMPDALLTMFVSNYQNIRGIKFIVERAREARRKLPVNRSKLMVLPVAGRDESNTEYKESMHWRGIFASELGHFFGEWLPKAVEPIEALDKLYIPYVPIWSFGERIPVLEHRQELSDPKAIGSSYLRLSTLLSNRLDWYSVFERTNIEDLKSAKIELSTTIREYESFRSVARSRTRRAVLIGVTGALLGVGASALVVSYVKNGSSRSVSLRWRAETGSPLLAAAFSPDGTLIASGSEDSTARIWTSASGRSDLLRGHHSAVGAVSFSPDGKRVLTGSRDGTARVWDAVKRKELVALRGHNGPVRSVAFSPDGARIITGSDDGTARVWDTATGKELLSPLRHEGAVRSATFLSDGARVVTASDDGTARVWDTATGRELLSLLRHEDAVRSATFSPDGARIVTASDDGTARVWDIATGEELIPPLRHQGAVRSATLSPDGTRVVTASDDGTARVWDAATGKELVALHGHKGPVRSATFSPDGARIVTVSADGAVRVWDGRSGSPISGIEGQSGGNSSATFSPNSQSIVTTGLNGEIRAMTGCRPTLAAGVDQG